MTEIRTPRALVRSAAGRLIRRTLRPALEPELSAIDRTVQRLAVQLGELISCRNAEQTDLSFHDSEFSTFSQWGEDGLLQYLLARTELGEHTFIEFGVEDYTEANTRFLLMKDNWRGLIIDADTRHITFTRQSNLAWRHEIVAVSRFITVDNINDIFRENGMTGDVGILSVDIDGNDYWILNAISDISPRIVVCEYNSVFGRRRAVTIPYDPHFLAAEAHYSHLYFGASLAALDHLLSARGYILVGCESHGANAFFVRSDVARTLAPLTPADAYVASRFRSSRDEHGQLSYLGGHSAIRALIADLPLVDVISGASLLVGDLPAD
jgi:hypothetical protein